MRLIFIIITVTLIGYFIMQQVNQYQTLYGPSDPSAPTTQDRLNTIQDQANQYQQKIQGY